MNKPMIRLKTLCDDDAFAHPAYGDAIQNSARQAHASNECFSIFWDGFSIYVRNSHAIPPPNSKVICIAQRWDNNTVQLRFAGVRAEWARLA